MELFAVKHQIVPYSITLLSTEARPDRRPAPPGRQRGAVQTGGWLGEQGASLSACPHDARRLRCGGQQVSGAGAPLIDELTCASLRRDAAGPHERPTPSPSHAHVSCTNHWPPTARPQELSPPHHHHPSPRPPGPLPPATRTVPSPQAEGSRSSTFAARGLTQRPWQTYRAPHLPSKRLPTFMTVSMAAAIAAAAAGPDALRRCHYVPRHSARNDSCHLYIEPPSACSRFDGDLRQAALQRGACPPALVHPISLRSPQAIWGTTTTALATR